MRNPFEFGRELGVDELVDRKPEIGEVVQTIRQSGKLFIIGPRRYGKTSILKAAEDRLRRDGGGQENGYRRLDRSFHRRRDIR